MKRGFVVTFVEGALLGDVEGLRDSAEALGQRLHRRSVVQQPGVPSGAAVGSLDADAVFADDAAGRRRAVYRERVTAIEGKRHLRQSVRATRQLVPRRHQRAGGVERHRPNHSQLDAARSAVRRDRCRRWSFGRARARRGQD